MMQSLGESCAHFDRPLKILKSVRRSIAPQTPNKREIGFKVLTGQGAQIDTSTSQGKLVFGIFAALAEFERDLIVERTNAGLASARARGRKGGARYKMTPAKLRLAVASMGTTQTHVGDLCRELGITRQTLYRHVSPKGELRDDGKKLLEMA
jgi:DNA invertase Pin-like site-specific DNA recombinase